MAIHCGAGARMRWLSGRALGRKEQREFDGASIERCIRWLSMSPLLLLGLAAASDAGLADVLAATAECSSSVCTFAVTVRHEDAGWDHYADSWEVVAPDGRVLATRVLRHPHIGEQPFTRELRGVEVPADVASVRLRAHDSVHGFGGREVVVQLSR